MVRIGLTGGIATGKSTVSAMLARFGGHLIDADKIAREVVEPGSPGLSDISARFGQAVLNEDGTLNRKKLASIIFNDAEARSDLEAILHPRIRDLITERIAHYEAIDPKGFIVVDIPLMLESDQYKAYQFDDIMVVYVPRDVQLKRLMNRDQLSTEEALKRLHAQMDIEEKRRLADIVIDNSDDLVSTQDQVEHYLRRKGLI